MITEQIFNGFLAFVFFVSIPVAAILSVVIRARYRKAIAREMMAHSGAPESAFDVPAVSRPNSAAVEFDVEPMSQRPPLRLGLAARYLLSGLTYAVVLVVVMFVINKIEFLPVRFSVIVASFLIPAIVMALYVAGCRWFWIPVVAVVWIGLLNIVAPQSNTVIGTFVAPALLLSLIVGNPALRTTAIPLFLVAISLVVPFVFSLDFLYFLMLSGVLDFLFVFLPVGLIRLVYITIAIVVALAVGILFALIAVRFVAWATEGSSEFTMQHDLLWLFQTIWVIGLGWGTNGAIVLAYFLAFVTYRVVLRLLRPGNRDVEVNLLLRVFGQQRFQTSLARGLLLDWRRKGPVLLIGASDLATETLDAPELAAFLKRRLKDIFIDSPEDLARAETAGETRLGDGLFPMQDYYCRDNSWRPTVLTLMSRAQRVLIDMRGFEQANEGIQYEIRALAERVPADRIIVVVEKPALSDVQSVFSDIWSQVGGAVGTDKVRCIVQA